MRVLYLSQLLPWPLDGGAKVRAQHVLRHLAGAGHQVTLCAFARPTDRADAIAAARALCTAVELVPLRRSAVRNLVDLLASWWGPRPFTIARDWLAPMRERVEHLVGSADGFDVVHADQVQMAPYALWARERARRQPGLVLDLHNATFRLYGQLAELEQRPLVRVLLARESRRLAGWEREVVERFDHVVWVSDVDRQALAAVARPATRWADRAPSTVLPIALDPRTLPRVKSVGAPHRVTLLGGLHWPPNADAARWMMRRVWPAVHARHPRSRLTVVGRCPPGERRWLARHGGGGVEVRGYLEDPGPELSETAVLAVPLRAGSGVRVKILEAWCRGLPVVSTRLGAEGLEAVDGHNLLLADEPRAFADAVNRLLESPSLRAELAEAGRHTVLAHYDYRTAYPAWDGVYGAARAAATALPSPDGRIPATASGPP